MEVSARTRLYEAIWKGDEAIFLNLLKEDPFVLDRCTIDNNSGRFMQSPLHAAADKGNLDVVNDLLAMNCDMCLARDEYGRTPIHVAAAKGQVKVVEVLHHANRYAAQERTIYGESILHLCVKHSQLEALKILLKLNNDDGDQLINSKDNNGNTILHLAVTSKQPEMVEHLVEECKSSIEINALNNKDMTVVDVYKKQNKKDVGDRTIEKYLKRAKAKQAKHTLDHQAERLENQRSALMVVASLIATMAFQVGINPPGGVWQESKKENFIADSLKPNTTYAGTAIWSYYDADFYNHLVISNTIAFVASLSVIMLLISGLPFKRTFFISTLRVTLWISVTATSLTYLSAVANLPYSTEVTITISPISAATLLSYIAWLCLIGVICFGNVLLFLIKMIGWQRRESIARSCRHFRNWFAPTNTNTNDFDNRL